LTVLRRRDANKKCPWSKKNWKILDSIAAERCQQEVSVIQ
jgi:hypothetical protein